MIIELETEIKLESWKTVKFINSQCWTRTLEFPIIIPVGTQITLDGKAVGRVTKVGGDGIVTFSVSDIETTNILFDFHSGISLGTSIV